MKVLKLMKENPKITQKEMAEKTRKSVRTVKRIAESLVEKKYVQRTGGKRYGSWEMVV